MARKKADASGAPQTIEPDRFYRVKFRLPHAIGRMKFSPLHKYRLRGSVLTEIPVQKIASAEELT